MLGFHSRRQSKSFDPSTTLHSDSRLFSLYAPYRSPERSMEAINPPIFNTINDRLVPSLMAPPAARQAQVQANAVASSSMVKPSTKTSTSIRCISCHVPLDAPSQYQTPYILCPPCQSRNAALAVNSNNVNVNRNGNSQERAVPRGNPYPVVRPITTPSGMSALSIGFTYTHTPAFLLPSASTAVPVPISAATPLRDANTGTGTNTSDRVDMTALRRGEDMLRVCMRFGCGARLSPYVSGDMCETCAGAGFSRPPPAPPMVLPKRVPRRAKERTYPLPRESLDLVRASLLREAAEKAKAASAAADDDDDMDLDLIYPEDIPESSPPIPTASEAKAKSTEDEKIEKIADVDPELMHPEAAGKVARKQSVTSRAPSTSLHELVNSGLKIIPTLDDVAVPVDDRPQPRCQTPGCNDVLPSHTCMQRCVKCCLGAWRERKRAAMEDPGPSRRPSTVSMTSSADSAEAREVASMLEQTSDTEEQDPLGTDPPPRSSSPSKGSSDAERYIPGWDSDLTDLSDSDDSDSDSDSVSDSDSDPGPEPEPEPDLEAGLHEKPRDSNSLKIRIPLLIYRLPSHTSLRKCSYKRCNIALPKDHRWKACAACRRAQNEYQKSRYRKLRHVLGLDPLKSPDLSVPRWRSPSPDLDDPESTLTLTLRHSRPCSVRHCRTRIPLPDIYKWKTCPRCRTRARRKRDALVLMDTVDASESCQREVVPRFQAYQHRSALMGSFEAQLRGFVDGQILFLRAKLAECGWGRGGEGVDRGVDGGGGGGGVSWKPERIPMVFGFAGEYSIISAPRGGSKGEEQPQSLDTVEAMRKEVSVVVTELERMLCAKFKSGEAFAIDSGGIIMRFTCSLELLAQLRPLSPSPGIDRMDVDVGEEKVKVKVTDTDTDTNTNADTSKSGTTSTNEVSKSTTPQTVPLVKKLSGELEAVIVPDESHLWYHGRRTVVRFGMVG